MYLPGKTSVVAQSFRAERGHSEYIHTYIHTYNALRLRLLRTEPRLQTEKLRRNPGPPRAWGKVTATHYNKAIADTNFTDILTGSDLTALAQQLTGAIGAAGKLARKLDTEPGVFTQSHSVLLTWQRDQERRKLDREHSRLLGTAKFVREEKLEDLRRELKKINTQRARLQRQTNNQIEQANADLMRNQFYKAPRGFWQVLKQNQTARDIIPIPFADCVQYLQVLADAPRTIVTTIAPDPTLEVPPLPQATAESSAALRRPVTLDELEEALGKAANGKSADEDGIIMEQWKAAGSVALLVVVDILNRMLDGEVLDEMGRVKMTLIHKKGPKTVVGNYRAVSVGPMLEKLFSMVWGARLTAWAEHNGLLCETQWGFRARRGTGDAIFTVEALLTLARHRQEKLVLVFVDFTKAFDTIDRDRLWDKLARMGVPEQVLVMFRMAYGEVWGRIKDVDGTKSPYVSFKTGVKQGDPLSTLFFILFINDVVAFMRANGARGVDVEGEGGEPVLNLVALLFADDTTLVAKSIPDARRLLKLLSAYACMNGLEVNVAKTQWMGYRTGRTSGGLSYREVELKKVDSFCFLGYHLTSTGSAQVHLASRQARMTTSLGMWLRLIRLQPGMPSKLMLDTFFTLVASGGQYGNHLAPSGTSNKDLLGRSDRDAPVRTALRLVTGLPRSTPVVALFSVTGRHSLVSMDHKAMLRYWFSLGGKDKVVTACGAALKRMALGTGAKGNWMDQVRKLLVFYGGEAGERMWMQDQRTWSFSQIDDIVDAKCDEAYAAAVQSMPRLDFLRRSDIGEGESVVLQLKLAVQRKDMLRLLCSGHKLAIETGRHANLPIHERRCTLDPTETEDEEHCLFVCSANADLRLQLEGKLSSVGRVWSPDTWVWTLDQAPYAEQTEKTRRRRALEAVATFVSKSMQRARMRAGGPTTCTTQA